MAIEFVNELAEVRGRQTETGLKETTRRFQVKSNIRSESIFNIFTHVDIPNIYSAHPQDSLMFARAITPNQDEDAPEFWDVDVPYSNALDPNQEDDPNPLNRPAEFDWASQTYRRIAVKDQAGIMILNGAGDPPVPPFEEEAVQWIINVRKNVASVPSYILTYEDVINSDSVSFQGLTFDPLLLKIGQIRISPLQYEGGVAHYVFVYTMVYREEGWSRLWPWRGYRELIDTTDALSSDPPGEIDANTTAANIDQVQISDEQGDPISEPALINIFGQNLRRHVDKPDFQNIEVIEITGSNPPTGIAADKIIIQEIHTKARKTFTGTIPLS